MYLLKLLTFIVSLSTFFSISAQENCYDFCYGQENIIELQESIDAAKENLENCTSTNQDQILYKEYLLSYYTIIHHFAVLHCIHDCRGFVISTNEGTSYCQGVFDRLYYQWVGQFENTHYYDIQIALLMNELEKLGCENVISPG